MYNGYADQDAFHAAMQEAWAARHAADIASQLRPDYAGRATSAVFVGNYLPAHDAVFDAAEEVAGTLARLHAYIASVRDAKQATHAITELLDSLAATPTV